jgi:hypothetical protein
MTEISPRLISIGHKLKFSRAVSNNRQRWATRVVICGQSPMPTRQRCACAAKFAGGFASQRAKMAARFECSAASGYNDYLMKSNVVYKIARSPRWMPAQSLMRIAVFSAEDVFRRMGPA